MEGKYPPPSLRAYTEIPWHKLSLVVKQLLTEGDKHAGTHHVFFIACDIAKLYRYKKVVKAALTTWCWTNKALQHEVPRMVDWAYSEVYRHSRREPSSGRDEAMAKLTSAGRAVLDTLQQVQSQQGEDWFAVSLTALRDKSGVSRATVIRQLAVLKELGLVEMMSGVPEGGCAKGVAIGQNLYRLPAA